VSLAVSLRDDEVGHRPSNRLVVRPPEHIRCAIIPISHDPIGLHDNYGIKSGFQDQAQPVSR
jgi:hypothetical protein